MSNKPTILQTLTTRLMWVVIIIYLALVPLNTVVLAVLIAWLWGASTS